MEYKCKKCGAEVSPDTLECPKCKVTDPLGHVTDEAERFNEEQVVEATGKIKK